MKTSPSPHRTRLLASIETTSEALDTGKTKVRELVAAAELDAVKLGKLTMITWASIEAYVARLPKAGSTPPPAAAMRARSERRQEAKRDAA